LIAFVYSSEKIDLSRFASFFKNDQIFAMLALNKIEGFPIQAITVAPNGELLRSYLAKEITETLPQGIFDIPNNAIELK
jgi:hypothetical protein